jgi:hypothetical protein
MRKSPLIGISICAVVLLVLGSLSNVVGYQSVKSTMVNDSPLFKTRTQRATNQQQNILTSQYLGKGNGNLLYFPVRDERIESIQRAIEIISKMDDKGFRLFTTLCIQKVKQDKTLNHVDSDEIIQTLQVLRTKPETILHSYLVQNNQNASALDLFTSAGCTVNNWIPGCYIWMVLSFIMALSVTILLYILLKTSHWTEHCPHL